MRILKELVIENWIICDGNAIDNGNERFLYKNRGTALRNEQKI